MTPTLLWYFAAEFSQRSMDIASTDPHIPCASPADLDFIRKLLNPLSLSRSPPYLSSTFALNSLLVVQIHRRLMNRVGIGLPLLPPREDAGVDSPMRDRG